MISKNQRFSIKVFVIMLLCLLEPASLANDRSGFLAPTNAGTSEYQGLKNPTAPDFSKINLKPKKSSDNLKPIKRKKNLGIKPARLNFKNVKIKGVVSQPRLQFVLDELAIDQADEDLPSNFIDLIYDEMKDNDL